MDPTIKNSKFLSSDIKAVPDSLMLVLFLNIPTKERDIITSIAMFYDLKDPNLFVENIAEVLSPNGIWN